MTVTAVTSGAEKRNGGTILFGGNIPSTVTKRKSLDLITNTKAPITKGRPLATWVSGVGFAFVGGSVSITSITQNGSTGKVLITKSSHGLLVGAVLRVEGVTPSNYNCTHTVTVVVDANTVQTDVTYTVDSSVSGTYKPIARNFAKEVRKQYIGMIIGSVIAGTADTTLVLGGAYWKQSYNPAAGEQRYNITGIDYFTGVVTYGGNQGVINKYHDIAANNENLASEPLPTRAVPGRIVFTVGAPTPSKKSYNPKTE